MGTSSETSGRRANARGTNAFMLRTQGSVARVISNFAPYTHFAQQEFAVQDLFQMLGCPGTLLLIGNNKQIRYLR